MYNSKNIIKFVIFFIILCLCPQRIKAEFNPTVMANLKGRYGNWNPQIVYLEQIDCYHISGSPRQDNEELEEWLCDSKGNVLISLEKGFKFDLHNYSFIENRYIKFKKNNLEGLYDIAEKQEILPPEYEIIDKFFLEENRYIKIKKNGLIGYYDILGKHEIIPTEYDNIYNENRTCNVNDKNEKLFRLKKDNKTGFFTMESGLVIPLYSQVEIINDSIAIIGEGIIIDGDDNITENGKWGLFSIKYQKLLTELEYDWMSSAGENLITCNKGGVPTKLEKCEKGKFGVLDFNGKEIIPCNYQYIGNFYNGYAQVKINDEVSLLKNPLISTSYSISVEKSKSSIDTDIPITKRIKENVFAIIISNEEYPSYDALYAHSDGETVQQYCEKRLGIPKQNIKRYKDLTYGGFQSLFSYCSDIADVYGGEASFFIYFAGIGYLDPTSNMHYLLPVDGILTNLSSTAISLEETSANFKKMKFGEMILMTDCPFSGVDREGNIIIHDRGIAISNKLPLIDTQMVWLAPSLISKDSTTHPDLQHGMLTYSFLELLKSKDIIPLSTLAEDINKRIKEISFKYNGKISYPSILLPDSKKNLKL